MSILSVWRKWLKQNGNSARTPLRNRRGTGTKLLLETLEERLTPALDFTGTDRKEERLREVVAGLAFTMFSEFFGFAEGTAHSSFQVCALPAELSHRARHRTKRRQG